MSASIDTSQWPALAGLASTMAAFGDRHYDPEWRLLRLPAGNPPSVHLAHLPPTSEIHPIRESLHYALMLLDRDATGDVARATDILHRVFDLQGTHDFPPPADVTLAGDWPKHLRDGLWHYIAEESVMDWPFPDLNWADFNGLTLLLIWHLHRARLDAPTLDRLREAVRRAASCIRRRNVSLGYTNIAIKGTFVTLAAAELLGDTDLLDYAVDRARRLHAEVSRSSCFAEYNSPTYAAVSLAGLVAIDRFVRHEPSLSLMRELQDIFWRHVATHFHVPTSELAGPHSRAYTIRLFDAPHLLGTLLHKASNGKLDFDFTQGGGNDAGFGAIYGYFLDPVAPPDVVACLTDPSRVASVVEIADPREKISAWWRPQAGPESRDGSVPAAGAIPARITTFINPAYSLGTVNLQDGWEQRQNLIAYWPGENPGSAYLRHRYLHDTRPCCSGYFASDQKEGRAAVAAFLVQYCDTHVSIPADEITARFLGPVIDVDAQGEVIEGWLDNDALRPGVSTAWAVGSTLWLRLRAVWIAIRLDGHFVAPFSHDGGTVVLQGTTLEARFPHYDGPLRSLRWTDFQQAHTFYSLQMSAPLADWDEWRESIGRQTASVRFADGRATFRVNDLKVATPASVIARECLPGVLSDGARNECQ